MFILSNNLTLFTSYTILSSGSAFRSLLLPKTRKLYSKHIGRSSDSFPLCRLLFSCLLPKKWHSQGKTLSGTHSWRLSFGLAPNSLLNPYFSIQGNEYQCGGKGNTFFWIGKIFFKISIKNLLPLRILAAKYCRR